MTSDTAMHRTGLLPHRAEGCELDYFAYIPETATSGSPLLVSIHGIERLALQHAMRFAPYAERRGFIVLAPHFSKERMPQYQRTAASPKGECPVKAFELTIDHLVQSAGLAPTATHLFGYSGGAQFAMRYLLRGKLSPARVALAAPGWFTMPDHTYTFPYGLRYESLSGVGDLKLERLLSTPLLLTVGSADTIRNSSLNREPLVDVQQGMHRLERATRWAEAISLAAQARGMPERLELRILEGAAHSFQDNMSSHDLGQIVTDWLLA